MSAERLKEIKPAATIEISTKIRQMRQNGEKIISLNIGEPDFPPPEEASQGVRYALEQNISQYGAVPGFLELRERICEKLKCDNGINYSPEEICISTGTKQAVFNTLMAVCGAGDEVLIPTPCWVSYDAMIRLCGATPVAVPLSLEDGFQLNIDAIKEKITPRTKAIIINTPNNPTGAVYSFKALTQLAELAVQHHFWILSDEIYEKIIFDDNKHTSIAGLSNEAREHCITLNGFSKAYAIPGWRVGYSAAPRSLAKDISTIQGHMTSAASSIAQYGAYYAMRYADSSVQAMVKEYSARRKLTEEKLHEIPHLNFVTPQGTFYYFVDVKNYFGKNCKNGRIESSGDLVKYILEEAHVALVPGEAFDMAGFVRLSFSNSKENINAALDQMKIAIAKLQ